MADNDKIICQTCHRVHGAVEETLTTIKSDDAKLCQQCHQRHTAKDIDSAAKKGIHPVNIKLEKAVTINNKEITTINCLTCHSPHNAKSNSALLVIDNKNGELCNVCHKDYNRLVNTDHDFRRNTEADKNRYNQTPEQAGACGICHSMHRAEDNKLRLDATSENKYQGKEKPLQQDRICLNCHHKDGPANKSQIKYFSHPDKKLILRSDKNNMPLSGKNNKPANFGKITCTTCHNPHHWSANKKIEHQEIKAGKPKKNLNGNINSSFLRNKDIQNSFCVDCHGIETRIKYKYYHLDLSRKTEDK